MFGFQSVTENVKGLLKFCASYMAKFRQRAKFKTKKIIARFG